MPEVKYKTKDGMKTKHFPIPKKEWMMLNNLQS